MATQCRSGIGAFLGSGAEAPGRLKDLQTYYEAMINENV